MAFEKETKENIEKENNRMNEAISKLTDSTFLFGDSQNYITVNHRLMLTMIDSKIVNAVTDNKSTQVPTI